MRNAIANAIGIGMKGVSSGNAAVINTVTPVTVKGGVVRVIDSATGDIARTTTGWIEDEKYGWYAQNTATAWSAEFDTAVTRTGAKTVKVSTTDVTGRVEVYSAISATPANSKKLFVLKPSTTYRLSCYIKTTTTENTVGARVRITEFDSAYNTLATNNGTGIKGTQDWTLSTVTFTTNGSTALCSIKLSQLTAGNISDAWFDVNSMTLEEVSSITNSGTFPALYYPKATAVTSTDNIDQSQVAVTSNFQLGNNTLKRRAGLFIPTKKNLTGVIIRKGANVGTPTFDTEISIQTNNAGVPSGTKLGTPVTITAAQWDAIANNTDYLVSYLLTLTPGTTYWIVYTPATQGDASNYRTIYYNSAGTNNEAYFDTSWHAESNKQLYQQTLYSKNTDNFTVATDTQTLSVTAPTVDGWANGTIIDTSDGTYGVTPLTLAVGANNVYYSSNGPATADGTVDASLQSTISGTYIT